MSVLHTKGNSKMGYDTDALFERLHQELVAMTPQSPHTPSDSFYGAIPQEAPEAVQSHENESSMVTYTGVKFESGMRYEIHANGFVYDYTHTEPDYDAILLAARTRRERQNIIIDADADDARTWDARLDAALGVPLTFDRRVGWKGGPIE